MHLPGRDVVQVKGAGTLRFDGSGNLEMEIRTDEPPSGPLAANYPRYWTLEGDVLTIGTKADSGNPTTVGRWRRQAS